MKEGEAIKVKQSELSDRMDQIVEQLSAICEACDLKGMKHGKRGFEYHGWTSRETLSVERLVEEGVAAATIAKCRVKGKPFVSYKFILFDME